MSSFSTSTQLTDYDDGGLLWRTAATDAGQAVALAALINNTPNLSHVAIVYVDDTYGRPLQQGVNVELDRIGKNQSRGPRMTGMNRCFPMSSSRAVKLLRSTSPSNPKNALKRA